MNILQIPSVPTPEDVDSLFDRLDALLDRLENGCMILLVVLIILVAFWVLTKIFGGKGRG